MMRTIITALEEIGGGWLYSVIDIETRDMLVVQFKKFKKSQTHRRKNTRSWMTTT
jgi:hypothetical protein